MSTQKTLSNSRSQIDAIDEQILELLQLRNQVVRDIVKAKIAGKLPVFVPLREDRKVKDFRAKAETYELDPEWAEDFLRMIMSSSRASQSSGRFPSSTSLPKTILMVGGNGSMGRLYAQIACKTGHIVRILDKGDWSKVATLCRTIDAAIIMVPIHRTHEVLKQLAPHLPENAVLADFTSTKNGLLDRMLELHRGPVVSLHPMHGPDIQNLSKQLMLVLPGRRQNEIGWLIKQFELWGMRIKTVDPEKHDHAMHMIQGLRHFIALLHGSFMRAYDLKPGDILDFSSPVYRAELMMTGRIFAQDAELYADIVFSDDNRRSLLKEFFRHHQSIAQLVETNDKEGFINEFNAVGKFFGEFADQALRESGYLINRLADRFA